MKKLFLFLIIVVSLCITSQIYASPTIEITQPHSGDVLSGTITITAETSGGEVSQVRFYIDGRMRGTDDTSPL